ncbi:MAG: amidohydrolase family protein [Candidatus Kapaibacterium sp.]
MKPINAEVFTEGGIITKILPRRNGVIIHSGGKKYSFDDSVLLPGLVDSHAHLAGLGMMQREANLAGAKSEYECIGILKKHTGLKGDWITGKGWNHEKWHRRQFPTKESLDNVFPGRPAYMLRADHHSAWVNSEALKRAGIDRGTPDPTGGKILKDENGEPTGVLIDTAMNFVTSKIPDYTREQYIKMIEQAMEMCLSVGLTEIHDMDVHPDLAKTYIEMNELDLLKTRVQAFISGQYDEWKNFGINKFSSAMYNITGVKFFADGALGSRGAALLEPYKDDPGNTGLILFSELEFFEKIKKAVLAGFNIASHAIGDAAVRFVLNAYGRVRAEFPELMNILRVEHAQTIHTDDIHKFVRYGAIPVVQSIHCISDAAAMAERRLGSNAEKAYRWKSLLEAGLPLPGGSDFPVESHNPFIGIEAYLRRVPEGRKEAWYPEEIITFEEALKSYTLYAHTAAGISTRGKIQEGFDADLTIIDRDISSIAPEEIHNTQVKAVFTEGKLNYYN